MLQKSLPRFIRTIAIAFAGAASICAFASGAMAEQDTSMPKTICPSLSNVHDLPNTLFLHAATVKADAQASARRFALIVGDGDYTGDLKALPKAAADARDMAKRVSELGFQVVCFTEVRLDQFQPLLTNFVEAIPPASLIVFYYAGHGAALQGRNYLLPTGLSVIHRPQDIQVGGLAQAAVIDYLLIPQDASVLLFLDTCRTRVEIPSNGRAPAQPLSGFGASGAGNRTEVLSGYAADFGGIALEDAEHGYYTETLTEELTKPGETVSDLLGHVHEAVVARTKGDQVPGVYFTGSVGATILREPRNDDEEWLALIQRTKDLHDCANLSREYAWFQVERPHLKNADLIEHQILQAMFSCSPPKQAADADTAKIFALLGAYGSKLDADPTFSTDWIPPSQNTLVVTASDVLFRTSDSRNAAAIGSLSSGTKLEPLCDVEKCGSGWVAVRKGNVRGFVASQYVDRADVLDSITLEAPKGLASFSSKDADRIAEFTSAIIGKSKGFRVISVAPAGEAASKQHAELLAFNRASKVQAILASLKVDRGDVLLEAYASPQASIGAAGRIIVQALGQAGIYKVDVTWPHS